MIKVEFQTNVEKSFKNNFIKLWCLSKAHRTILQHQKYSLLAFERCDTDYNDAPIYQRKNIS